MDNDAPIIEAVDSQAPAPPVVVVNATGEDTRAKLPPSCAWNDDGSVTQALLHPVQMTLRSNTGDTPTEYTTLQFKPLKGKQLLAAQGKSGDDRTVSLIGSSLGLSPLVARVIVDSMDGRDFVRAVEIIGVFTDSGRTTGQ